jgi:hypothetical protein
MFYAGKRFQLVSDISANVLSSAMSQGELTNSILESYKLLNSLIGGEDRKKFDTPEAAHKHVDTLGKLHAIFESAGKIRIVAIVDYWTNFALKPLHDWMFSILEKLPTDAAFDQEGRLREFTRKGYSTVYSVDLSAATDTIPTTLYHALLSPILGDRLTSLWLELLVGRNFLVPKEALKENPSVTTVKYTCGQPMGALSSWSSMALVHHALVQFSAIMAKEMFLTTGHFLGFLQEFRGKGIQIKWFSDYLILGDDIAIADKGVADIYLSVAKALGIKINMKKSFVSDKGFVNFANQSYAGENNFSPLSFKEYIGVASLNQRAEMAMRIVRRGWVDISNINWIAPLMKLFVNRSIWLHIHKDLSQGRTHPIVNWVLSVLLVPASERFSKAVLPRVSIRTYLATMLQKAVIWTKPVSKISELVKVSESWVPVRKILLGLTDNTYNQFLVSKRMLEHFPTYVKTVFSVDSEDLLVKIFYQQVKERLTKWEEAYRKPLKTYQVMLRLPDLEEHMFELGGHGDVNTAVETIMEASNKLPIIPEYSSLDARIFTDRPKGRDAFLREKDKFLHFFNLIKASDDLETATRSIRLSNLVITHQAQPKSQTKSEKSES